MDTMITSHDGATDNAGMRPVRFIGFAAATRPHRLPGYPLVSKRTRKNAQLSRVPRLLPSVISKIGHRCTRVSAGVMRPIPAVLRIPIAEPQQLMAVRLAAEARSES